MDIEERVCRYIEFGNDFSINKAIAYNSTIYKTNKQNNYIKYKGNFCWNFKKFIIY